MSELTITLTAQVFVLLDNSITNKGGAWEVVWANHHDCLEDNSGSALSILGNFAKGRNGEMQCESA